MTRRLLLPVLCAATACSADGPAAPPPIEPSWSVSISTGSAVRLASATVKGATADPSASAVFRCERVDNRLRYTATVDVSPRTVFGPEPLGPLVQVAWSGPVLSAAAPSFRATGAAGFSTRDDASGLLFMAGARASDSVTLTWRAQANGETSSVTFDLRGRAGPFSELDRVCGT